MFPLLAACSAEIPLDPPSSPATSPPPPPEEGVRLHVVGDPLEPGEEVERCRWIKAGNTVPAAVTSMRISAGPGLHHSIVSRVDGLHDDAEEPCAGFPAGLFAGFLMPEPLFATSTQVDDDALVLPDGVGVTIGADQQLVVDYHVLNLTDDVIVPELFVDLELAEPDAIDEEARFFLLGDVEHIEVPPQGTQDLTLTCPFPAGGDLLTLTPHMHSLARGFEAWTTGGELLYEGEGWFDPVTARFEPSVPLAAGEGLTFTCSWENPTDTVVTFGEQSGDEMCFTFGFATGMAADVIGLGGSSCTVDRSSR